MDYADVGLLEKYGGFKPESTSEDTRALLQHMISAASQMIDQYCGRVFGIEDGAATTTRTFTQDNGLLPATDRDDQRVLYFDDDIYTVVNIPTITAGVTLTWMPDHPPYYAIIRSEGVWEDPTTIVAHWAYSLAPPVAIIQATLRLALWMYRQRESTDTDRPIITQSGQLIMPSKMPADIEFILAPFRRVRLP